MRPVGAESDGPLWQRPDSVRINLVGKMNIGVIYNSFCYKTPLPEEAEMRATALAIGSYLSRMGYQGL